jgi:hypothetical protein
MMLPQDWEGVARERMRSWEKEMQQQQLLAQLTPQPSRWRRWTGSGLVWIGTWLLRWGERMAQRECRENVAQERVALAG